MASENIHRRAATWTLAYVLLGVIASYAHLLVERIDKASSQADEAASMAGDATSRADQNASDISDLQDRVDQLQDQLDSQ